MNHMVLLIMAWRNIWRNRMRSLVIILSVAIGLFCGMMVLAIYKGMMSGRVKTVIGSETGSIQIHNKQFSSDMDPVFIIKDRYQLLGSIQRFEDLSAYTERTVTQGMLSTATGSAGVKINGVDPQQEDIAFRLKQKCIEGNGFEQNKKSSILIGKKLAIKLKIKKGGKLVLTFSDSVSNLVSAAFRVAAIYQTDNAPFDERNVYVNKAELNHLLGIGSSIHEIAVVLSTDGNTEKYKMQLQQQFPNYLIESWRDLSPETELMVNTIDVYSYIIIGIILFALSFGIVNVMLMAVLERTREIGMMMALGLNKARLFLLILLETIFLTLAGVPLGLLVALVTTNYYQQHGIDWSGMGKEMMSSFGFSTTIYPEFAFDRLLPVLFIVIVTALLSCVFPAYRALRLLPVEALKK